ncbi:MAG TPA: STAS domain-containing protein [Pseudomonadales bacterium]|nr:STAS domain-containing protein [Pseudomonadales bacterium]
MQQSSICYGVLKGVYVIKFSGEIRVPTCASLNAFTQVLLDDPALQGVIIDLTNIKYIDSTGLGLLVKIALGVSKRHLDKPLIVSSDENVNRTLEMTGFKQIFHILNSFPESFPKNFNATQDLPAADQVTLDLCAQVLDAHRALMALNEQNQHTFMPVIKALESEQRQQGKIQ